MAELITDLKTIARIAKRNERKNMAFRSFLKGELDWSDKKLDALVHEILQSVTEKIDCIKCANCCNVMRSSVLPEDLERLARRLGVSAQEFEDRYVVQDGLWENEMMSETPCPFLDDCMCTVYEDRPRDCREYPHIQKEGFRFRLFSVLENAEICPIVSNVLEQLKERFHW